MCVYVISDLHGNLDAFKKLLNKIDFKFDGSDSLYLLGDYVDWGKEPLNTLLYVMNLSQYDFIHVLIGNHDLMFLDQIKKYKINQYNLDKNWLYNNGGIDTFKQFLKLDVILQEKIQNFLENLPYVISTDVNGKKYIMAHACPVKEHVYDENLSEKRNALMKEYTRSTAVWERITRKIPSVIQWFDDEKIYENFICGHTITENIVNNHYSIIIRENDYIDIDCGAKIIGHKEYYEEPLARLAALRLDDFKEFYTR